MTSPLFTRKASEVDPGLDEYVRSVAVLHHDPDIFPVDLLVAVAVSVSVALDA